MLKKVGKETSIRVVHSAKSRARAKAKANKPKPNPKTDTARTRLRSQLHDLTIPRQSREHGLMNAQNLNKNRNENDKQNEKEE